MDKLIIDLESGATIINSNRQAALEVLHCLMTQFLPEAEQEISTAWGRQNLAELKQAIHKLHGGICYCGVPRLREALYTLETLLKQEEPPLTFSDLQSSYAIVWQEITLLKERYRELTQTIST